MKKQPSLILCILMDIIGCASYIIPGLGEFSDVVWAPVSGIIFFFMFGGWKGAFGGVFSFAEELLPGFDFIPTFTIAWIWQRLRQPASKNIIKRQNSMVTTGLR